MNQCIENLVEFVSSYDSIGDKAKLSKLVSEEFSLTKDRSVFYCSEFAIRFSSGSGLSFSNTVLSLSNLQKYDDRPFLVCLVTPIRNFILLSNTTFLKKISHSSQELRKNNIKGSFNGSDILKEFDGKSNSPDNFDFLYCIHENIGFEGNLDRLVEATTNIVPSGHKFDPTFHQTLEILDAPNRAVQFCKSNDFQDLKQDLDSKVEKYKNEILLASLIENVNIRGRVIEYIIAGEDELLRSELIIALQNKGKIIPKFKTENDLGDYSKEYDDFITETDVKTKILILDSNPKAYNLDKILEFLAKEKSVFMFYFIGIMPGEISCTALTSMFQTRILDATIALKHWAGRNSRGVSQLHGKEIKELLRNPSHEISIEKSKSFIQRILEL